MNIDPNVLEDIFRKIEERDKKIAALEKRVSVLEGRDKYYGSAPTVKYESTGLIRRKPVKKIRVTEAARRIGCSHDSILRGSVGNFKIHKLNDKRNSPAYVYEADVERFLQDRFRD